LSIFCILTITNPKKKNERERKRKRRREGERERKKKVADNLCLRWECCAPLYRHQQAQQTDSRDKGG
jgi:hypothetical protein